MSAATPELGGRLPLGTAASSICRFFKGLRDGASTAVATYESVRLFSAVALWKKPWIDMFTPKLCPGDAGRWVGLICAVHA